MINVRIQAPEAQQLSPKITVVGVGGAGGNAVNNMISSNLEGCEFLACNTDAQALEGSLSDSKIQLGVHVTNGLGSGAKPEIGHQAAQESLDEVMQFLEGSNMAFVTAGMGGGTGTGAAPVIAKACRDAGILTVGVVTKPFHFEGTHRMEMAEAGIQEMQGYVDTLIIIPNQNLFRVANEKTTFADAFKMADSVLQSGVRGVTDLMVMPGLINLDFADIRSAMLEMGKAMMGTGESQGERRAIEAAESAINNPLLDDVSMKGARGVIINVTGGHDMTLFEVDEACNRIRDEVDPNANIIFGSTFDDKLEGTMRVSVVATGIDAEEAKRTGSGTGGVKITSVVAKKTDDQQKSQTSPQTQQQVTSAASRAAFPGQGGVRQVQGTSAQGQAMRARPNTPSSLPGVLGGARTGVPIAARPTNAPLNISAAPAAATPSGEQTVATSSEATAEEPDSDMFEQKEFGAGGQSAARGAVYGGAFIPPKPVTPERTHAAQQVPGGFTTGFVQPQQQAQVHQQQEQTVSPLAAQQPLQNPPATGLRLTPPTPGQSSREETKKTPSLFERITGFARTQESEREQYAGFQQELSSGQQAQQVSSPLQTGALSASAPQGSLNIDSPSASKTVSEEDLDIPAFLRRQAN